MKFILLVLAGLSLAHADCVNPYIADPVVCFQNALKNAGEYFPKLANFLCRYYDIEYNEPEYRAALIELIEILECAGCLVDEILGFNHKEIETLLSDAGYDVKELGEKVIGLLDGLGLSPSAAKLLCELLGKVFTSECLSDLLAHVLTDVVGDLKRIICQGYDDGSLTDKEIIEILANTGCIADTALDGVTDLETFLGDIGTDLGPLVNLVLSLLKKLLIVLNPLLCNVLG